MQPKTMRFDQVCAALLRVIWEKEEKERKLKYITEHETLQGYRESKRFDVMIPLQYLVDVEQGKGSAFAFGIVHTDKVQTMENTFLKITRHKDMDQESKIIMPIGKIQ